MSLCTGELLAGWLARLDPALRTLPVGSPHSRDSAEGFARLSQASLFAQIPAEEKTGLIARVTCP